MPDKPNYGGFRMEIPPLPKDDYLWLKSLKSSHGLSQWKAIVLAVRIAKEMQTLHPGLFQNKVDGLNP